MAGESVLTGVSEVDNENLVAVEVVVGVVTLSVVGVAVVMVAVVKVVSLSAGVGKVVGVVVLYVVAILGVVSLKSSVAAIRLQNFHGTS